VASAAALAVASVAASVLAAEVVAEVAELLAAAEVVAAAAVAPVAWADELQATRPTPAAPSSVHPAREA
jgi:hypothetical protein